MTKQDLRQYTRLGIELKGLQDKIETLENKLTSPKGQIITDMPRGGPAVDLTDQMSKLIDLKNLYTVKYNMRFDQQMKIESAIDTLEDPVERALVRYKYIDGLTWEEVCVKIDYGWDRTHHLHRLSLHKLKSV